MAENLRVRMIAERQRETQAAVSIKFAAAPRAVKAPTKHINTCYLSMQRKPRPPLANFIAPLAAAVKAADVPNAGPTLKADVAVAYEQLTH